MARKPEGDLGAMAISKAKAADTVPFSTMAPPAITPPAGGLSKSLTTKLEPALYARLRDHCHKHEVATGTKLTHQQVMVQALEALLDAAP